jgi:uncharacterized phage protein (TIGR01671 family)
MGNREIKFRAWCGTKKEFVNPTYNNAELNDIFQLPFYYLQQFTGLKDKNSKDIYEGDIVELFGWGRQTSSDGNAVIIWDIDETGWNIDRQPYCDDRYDFRKAIQNCEIIGNIHEHKNLL